MTLAWVPPTSVLASTPSVLRRATVPSALQSHKPRIVTASAEVRRSSLATAWQAQFLALAAIWGSSFLFIKVLGERWPALWVAFGRIALGAATLLVLVAVRRDRLPRDRRVWLHSAVAAALMNAVPWTLFAYGE